MLGLTVLNQTIKIKIEVEYYNDVAATSRSFESLFCIVCNKNCSMHGEPDGN